MRALSKELWEHRPDDVSAGEVRTTSARAEYNGRALTRERPVEVTGIRERRSNDRECEELEWFDRRECVRRHAERDGIERHLVNKAAPSRVHLVAGRTVGIEV